MLTIVLFPIPTGMRAWIEDVVVDRGRARPRRGRAPDPGGARAGRRARARTVDLTSRPDREAANRLYARLGFEQRQTNVYRYAHRSTS